MAMKRIFASAALCGILALAAAVSCQVKMEAPVPESPEVPAEAYETRSLSINLDGTRINSVGTTMRWNTTAENMAVIGKVGGVAHIYQFTKSGDQGSTPAAGNFVCDAVDVGAELLYAVFPYSDGYTLIDDTTLGLSLSGTQNLNLMGSVSNNVLLAGKISGGTVTLKNVCAFLKFTLPERLINAGTSLSDVSQVTISGTGIRGAVEVDFSGAVPSVTGAGDSDSIVAKPKIKSDRGQSGTLYIPVLPGTYSSMSFTIRYTAADGHSEFVKASTSSNTLVRNEVYDCGTLSGPFAQSLSCTSSLSSTTLTMEAESVLWKYSGITNSDYSLQFRYKDSEDADIPANWTTVDAATVSGDDTDVTFSATATVTADRTYDVVALATADGVTKEAAAAGAKTKVSVTLDANQPTDVATVVYDASPDDGYFKVTTDAGVDKFPTFYPGKAGSGSKTFYRKVWDSSDWGIVETISDPDYIPSKEAACTVTKNEFDFTFATTTTSAYYTIWTGLFCFQNGSNIRIHCPTGYTITKVNITVSANKNCTYGIGSTATTCDKVVSQSYKDPSNPVSQDLVIPSPEESTDYYLIGGTNSNRLATMTVYYEY